MSSDHAGAAKLGPYAPFTDWAEPVRPGAGGLGWFTPHGPAIVAQSTCTVASAEVVDSLHDFIDLLLDAGLTSRVSELTLVLDFRSIERVQPAAAEHYLARATRRSRALNDRGHHTYLVTSASPVASMVMRTAAIAIRTVTRTAGIHFVNDPGPALTRHGIAAPPRGFLEAWLAAGRQAPATR